MFTDDGIATGLDAIETPAYVYDLAEARRSHARLRAVLPTPSVLYYSLKANPHPDVVRALLASGSAAEVSSPGELASAREAGAEPGSVLYTGPAKRTQDIDAAVSAGVRFFSVDSAVGVDQLAAVARAHSVVVRYLLRVSPERAQSAVGLAMTGVPSQFGADEATVTASPRSFTRHPEVQLDGLHLYLATNLARTDALMAQYRVAIETAQRLQSVLQTSFSVLDLGGGFGAPYAARGTPPNFEGLADALAGHLDSAFPGWRERRPAVAFESGRALSATCGRLLTRVLDVKKSHGRRVVVVDSGIHHLGGMSGLRRVPPLRPEVHSRSKSSKEMLPAMVCGPLCTPLDTWAGDHALPELIVGDILEVPNVGAYGLTASLTLFLSHPLPTEIVVDGSEVVGGTQLVVQRHAAVTPSAPGPDPTQPSPTGS